ncbi:hypothetical protein [Endozoicomonas sp. GU-1]|uniref:hypothetical protein n=1 Tax=Endozoicomonas sp. GU-1 TaxID=3009078 RepID=UPI0022B3DF9E|nr:hypothetical protein [Endozoicomonas sp. GU-1]WBA83447.1 hypothetical protein O2T12_10125 [Endozoicomonas sp. GU-1]WBA86379.1 hypothetical protein O3276_24795 [Endozoicomonas sp. GU-1]
MNATGCMATIRSACPEITPARQNAIEYAAISAGMIGAGCGAGATSAYLVTLCTNAGILKALCLGGACGGCGTCAALAAEDLLWYRSISVLDEATPNHLPVVNQPGSTSVLDVSQANEALNSGVCCEGEDQKTKGAANSSIVSTEPLPCEESPFKKIN